MENSSGGCKKYLNFEKIIKLYFGLYTSPQKLVQIQKFFN